MFKSVFSKYLSVVSLVVVGGFLCMTLLQVFLTAGTLAEDKQEMLVENASSVALHTVLSATKTEMVNGRVEYHLNPGQLTPLLSILSNAIDAHILITDSSGRVLIGSGSSDSSFVGNTALSALVPKIGESYTEVGRLAGLYQDKQYSAAVPIKVSDHVLGYVFASSPAGSMIGTLQANFKVYALSVLGALLVSFCVLWLMTYRFVRPLRQMAAATRKIAQGDFSARVEVKGKDEVAELGEALNHMAVSLSSVEMMRRSFVANVSHELKTPMTTISGFIDGILDGTVPPAKQAHYLHIVSDEVKRLSRLVHSMLDLSRIDGGEMKMTSVRMNLTEAVCSVLVSSEPRIEEKNLNITGMEDCVPIEIDGDYDLMSQVLYNLVDNAIKFTNVGGTIDIHMEEKEGRVYVQVRNTGAGIPADELPQIFERYYKSDRSRSLDKNGLGLGLYIVKTVIRLHGGEITVRSVEGEYTEFAFWVPAANVHKKL